MQEKLIKSTESFQELSSSSLAYSPDAIVSVRLPSFWSIQPESGR